MVAGRKPKPALIKQLEGNRSKLGRARMPDEPRPIGEPRVPLHLTAAERRLWADVVASLPVGLLSRADEGVLERYAVAWSRFREATKRIAKDGYMLKTKEGTVRNPVLLVQAAAAKEMNSAGQELGLSPAARARLTQPKRGAEDDPMDLLLGPDGDPDGAWSTMPKTRQ